MAEATCAHIEAVTTVKRAKRRECEECVKIGARWHLSVVTCKLCLDSIFRKSFVRIAVQPTFPWLRRCDHGMFARSRVRGRMTVRRVIATARRAAFLAYAQMDPR